MADVSKINLNGTVYNIKDSSAREDITTIEGKLVTVTYDSASETIKITAGGES